MKNSLEFTQAQVSQLFDVLSDSKLQELHGDVQFLLDKTDDLENRSRRNNLCFEGIPEQGINETWGQSESEVEQLISDKLELNAADVTIERAHRVGPKKQDKPRPIITNFLHFKDREKVLKASRKLKGTNQFIREGYSDRVAARRKELVKKMHEARKDGKTAFLRLDKLIIRDRPPSSVQAEALQVQLPDDNMQVVDGPATA